MRVLGVAVKIASRPRARCVLLDQSSSAEPTVVAAFDLTTGLDAVADQAHDLAMQLSARLTGLTADVVIIARADPPKVPSNAKGPKDRLLVEGALVHAAMTRGPATALRAGREIGAACGTDKQTALTDGAALDAARPEAAAAALSGLYRPPG